MAEIEQPAAAPLQEKEIEPKEGKGTTESLPGQHGHVVLEPTELRPACHLLGHLALLMVLESGSLITKTIH